MNVTLEAIKFNHDPNSATHDAFNIRRNETELVSVPEWRRGMSINPEHSPAAYASDATIGNTLTIKAKFKSTSFASGSLYVRAIDAYQSLLPLVSVNVLGEVTAKEVVFHSGESDFETFELARVRVWNVGVSASDIAWRWQFSEDKNVWKDFETTRHRIYTVVNLPQPPWKPNSKDNSNIETPWTDVLEYACSWAAGAQGVDQAAASITRKTNALGEVVVKYSSGPSYAHLKFDCTKFLRLLSGGIGNGQTLNCDDCATVVSTFANILGCELWQSGMGLGFDTNRIQLIGTSQFKTTGFARHAVAWKGLCEENDGLFDACLQVDADGIPTAAPEKALVATNLRFGRTGEQQYKFCLVASTSICVPRPRRERKRRELGSSYLAEERLNDQEFLSFLQEHYNLDKWQDEPSTGVHEVQQDLSLENLLQHEIFKGWELHSASFAKDQRFKNVMEALLVSSEYPTEALLKVTLYQCADSTSPRESLLQLLGAFEELNLARSEKVNIGEISFTENLGTVILFVRSRFLSVVRSAGKRAVSTIDFARVIDDYLIR